MAIATSVDYGVIPLLGALGPAWRLLHDLDRRTVVLLRSDGAWTELDDARCADMGFTEARAVAAVIDTARPGRFVIKTTRVYDAQIVQEP